MATTLYQFYANHPEFSQQNYEYVHKIVDKTHTTTAWYDTDAKSLSEVVAALDAAGKGSTAACRRIKAAMLGTRLQKGE